MLFGGLMHAGSVPVIALVMLLFMPIAVECVCPWCFGGLPSCSYDSNKKCPCDTTISENIALVAAVSSATAIAGGKYFKMPGVLAAKYLRMFTSASLAALGGESSATTAKWNGKSSASSFSTCDAYNTGREHQARHLLPDGTCRYKHACDKWVSDKGPAGKCLQAHSRVACSNPNRCDAKVEPKQQ